MDFDGKVDHQVVMDLFNSVEWRHKNCLLGDPGIAPATDADKVKITNNFHYRLEGKEYYQGAADDIASSSPATTTSTQFRKDIVAIDSAGAVTLIQGTAAASQNAAELPAVPSTKLALAYIEVQNSFTNESTDLTTNQIKKFTSNIDVTWTDNE